jgi:hypothetical protein
MVSVSLYTRARELEPQGLEAPQVVVDGPQEVQGSRLPFGNSNQAFATCLKSLVIRYKWHYRSVWR